MGGAHVLMLVMLVMKVMKVKGLVLLEVLVVVKAFVEEVLLFSLSSTPTPRTTPSSRPAGRGFS